MRLLTRALAILLLGGSMAMAQLPHPCCNDVLMNPSDCLSAGCMQCVAAPALAVPAHPEGALAVPSRPLHVMWCPILLLSLAAEVPVPPPKA